MMETFEWSRPQRQPWAGLAIAFLNTFWEVIKRYWPLLVILLLRQSARFKWYEIASILLLGFTIISSLMKFLFFRFYIEDNNLVIKKGWLEKQTQVIPLEKIQTVNIEQGPLHQLLNIVKIAIDTAGSQKTEATIDALHKSMAVSLREQLLSRSSPDRQTAPVGPPPLLIQLETKDLFKLSVSANHLETLFLLFTFVLGGYENLKDVDSSLFDGLDSVFPEGTIFPVLVLIAVVLILTIVVSTLRIFLRFYHFRVIRSEKGFSIRSGLTNVKERLVAFQKIQYISWKANWIRRLMDLWMFEFHIGLSDEIKNRERVHLPVTRSSFISILAGAYHAVPSTEESSVIRMHPAFVWRRTMLLGVLPTIILMASLWSYWQLNVLWILTYPFLLFILSWCTRRKFRLWAFEDVAFIRRGFLGESWTLIRWEKLQSVELHQSIYQRRKDLGSLTLHTAAGKITCNYIPLEAAKEIRDYALYKVEVHSLMC